MIRTQMGKNNRSVMVAVCVGHPVRFHSVTVTVDTNVYEKHIVSFFRAALQMTTVCFSEKLTHAYESTLRHNSEEHHRQSLSDLFIVKIYKALSSC
jgi:hypothetical protein